ncbi:hypothetical protein DFH08DRAFT_821950 [Mycena albidolilacea]|uniref:Uncharacterized protein n=1 Tax=Mycena albidolilacea TaxID=1033008 RepID=A0AAD6Z9B9_9AGAR|nr:hypothetical protein DFH08DRAFT_821950 [Mycena albidolilacea]
MRAERNGRAAGMDGLPRGETGRRRERTEVRREKDGRDAGGTGERRGWTGLRRGKYIERGAGRNGKEAGMDGSEAYGSIEPKAAEGGVGSDECPVILRRGRPPKAKSTATAGKKAAPAAGSRKSTDTTNSDDAAPKGKKQKMASELSAVRTTRSKVPPAPATKPAAPPRKATERWRGRQINPR